MVFLVVLLMVESTTLISPAEELQRLQDECLTMVTLLKQQERQERLFRNETAILAREAMLCGYQPELLEAVVKAKRKMVQRKIKVEAIKEE